MTTVLGVLIILGCLIIAALYTDKVRECNKLRRMVVDQEEADSFAWGTAIFTRQGLPELEAEIETTIQQLAQRQLIVKRRRTHKWGYEVLFETGYSVYVCNPNIAIPTLEANTLFIGDTLSVDQVLRIMSQHSGKISEVHLYKTEKVNGGEG